MTKKALLATIVALSTVALACCAGYIVYLEQRLNDDEAYDNGDVSEKYAEANTTSD